MCEDLSLLCVCVCVWRVAIHLQHWVDPAQGAQASIHARIVEQAEHTGGRGRRGTGATNLCAATSFASIRAMEPASTQATAATATQQPYQQGGAVQEDVKVGCNGANVRVGTACDERDIVIESVCEVPALLAAARCILVVPEALYRLAGGSTAVFRYVSTAVLW